MNRGDKRIGFLALRALVVTALVLVTLVCFDRWDITSIGEDVPPAAVEQSLTESR